MRHPSGKGIFISSNSEESIFKSNLVESDSLFGSLYSWILFSTNDNNDSYK